MVKLPNINRPNRMRHLERYATIVSSSKILGGIIITHIRGGGDSKLRQEQAGFRKLSGGTVWQIFVLRNVIEQCI